MHTVDQSLLLHHFHRLHSFGASGPAHNWFATYLSPGTQSVYLQVSVIYILCFVDMWCSLFLRLIIIQPNHLNILLCITKGRTALTERAFIGCWT